MLNEFDSSNAELAKNIVELIRMRNGELPQLTIQNIKEMALSWKKQFAAEPTFAHAVTALIEKINTTPEEKLKFIEDTAKITLFLSRLKSEIV